MKKYLLMFAFILPLMAQDSTEVKEESKETITEIHKFPSRKSFGIRVWMGFQDAEWKKFDAAHRRAHSKRGEHAGREYRGKKLKARRLVRLVVVGGIAYYIGYHQGEKHFNGGWDRRKDRGGRK